MRENDVKQAWELIRTRDATVRTIRELLDKMNTNEVTLVIGSYKPRRVGYERITDLTPGMVAAVVADLERKAREIEYKLREMGVKL